LTKKEAIVSETNEVEEFLERITVEDLFGRFADTQNPDCSLFGPYELIGKAGQVLQQFREQRQATLLAHLKWALRSYLVDSLDGFRFGCGLLDLPTRLQDKRP
jgi:hypothetical protein